MKILNNMKIGRRIILGLGSVLVLMIAGTVLAMWAIRTVNADLDKAMAEMDKGHRIYDVRYNLTAIYREMGIMILAEDTSGRETAKENLENHRTAYAESLAWLEDNPSDEQDAALLQTFDQAVTAARDQNNQVIELAMAGKDEQASQLYSESTNKLLPDMVKTLQDEVDYRKSLQAELEHHAETLTNEINIFMAVCIGSSILLSILIMIVITRSITLPVDKTLAQLSDMSKGDFTVSVDETVLERKDEMGDIGRALARLLESMKASLGQVRDGVGTLASASTQLSAISEEMTSSASETSSRAHGVASAAEEMSANTLSVAAGMEQATTNLRSVATATEEMTATISEIAGNSEKARRITGQAVTQADSISAAVRALGQSAQDIGKVTETITSISNQTNLLALNATIEAARAGAAGKGFAVVATEIKELAKQTAAATEDIKGKIASVQNSTAGTVEDIEKVMGVIREISDIVTTIATAIEEQSVVTKDIAANISQATSGVDDANHRVAQTSSVAQSVAHDIAGVSMAGLNINNGSQQVQSSAQELSQLAEQLRHMVLGFKV
jgi:methyl-accepting chemotaxis protein